MVTQNMTLLSKIYSAPLHNLDTNYPTCHASFASPQTSMQQLIALFASNTNTTDL
jgi:hypothetical protein